jgi:multidrug efflux pump
VNLSSIFIRRPVGTTLLTLAIALAGIIGFRLLPVAPLPQVDFPTISVSAGLPGASPQTMASAVATPLEKQFGHIASVTEMTSTSYLGSTGITLQFDLNRDINAAARDVEAAINAAKAYLPANLPTNPSYRKVNPADAPVLIVAMTSNIYTQAQMYDEASSILEQKLSQVQGVGQVFVGGSSLPSVRVELNPTVVNKYGIGISQLASTLASANANSPKGEFSGPDEALQIRTTDQLFNASEYIPLIAAWQNGAPVRFSDLGGVVDSVQDVRNAGLSNGSPAILLVIFRQPAANIIDTVDRVIALLPQLEASIPPAMHLKVMVDRTTTIRASIHDVEVTLMISIGLVVLVVFIFLRNGWATFIPSVSVPVSLIGTFGVMYLLGYSIDNLSLMALTISTGFVVDDAIVVIENITRYIEQGMRPMQAALRGSREIGFTVLSMSTSLVAVFIPILMMGGIVGRLFREFAVTLSIAIAISMIVSLTTTPMMCSRLLKHQDPEGHGRLYRMSESFFDYILKTYLSILRVALDNPATTLLIVLITVGVNVYLFVIIPKGFFPDQDTGRMMGIMQGEQNISFQSMKKKSAGFVKMVMDDPAVENVVAFTGGSGGTNTGRMFVSLKDLNVRKVGVEDVIARLRKKTANVPGATLFMQPVQDIRVGGRLSNALYQFTLQTQDLGLLAEWSPKVLARLKKVPQIVDVNTDQQNNGLMAYVNIDHDTASRLGLTTQQIDTSLYQAFGQAEVSTMYTQLNQYFVVLEVAPQYWQNPDTLKWIYLQSSSPAGLISGPADAATTQSAGYSAFTQAQLTAPTYGGGTNTAFPAASNVLTSGPSTFGGVAAQSTTTVAPSASSTTTATPTTTASATGTGTTTGTTLPGTTSTTGASTGNGASTGTSSGSSTVTSYAIVPVTAASASGKALTLAGGSTNAASSGGVSATNLATTPYSNMTTVAGSATSSTTQPIVGGVPLTPVVTTGAGSATLPTIVSNGYSSASAVSSSTGSAEVPLSTFSGYQTTNTPISVNHQGQFPSVTISFNLPEGVSLGQAVDAITRAEEEIGMPATIQGNFAGTAQAFQSSLANEPILIATALIAVYIVLGMLYESYIHPITILSTLPSAGVGALLALLLFHNELSVIALIGIILLIGIVKKNAILMIDFALDAERREGKSSRDAIFEACTLRFRPITMTTFAAMLGGLPLAIGTGMGSELRRPLGIAIVGGLIVSQMLTLFTTPVVYLYMDRMRLFFSRKREGRKVEMLPNLAEGTD